MTKKEFIKILEKYDYSYEIVGNNIVVTYERDVRLDSLKTLPLGVKFNNGGNVYLGSLKTLPPGVEFNNRGNVWLDSLKTLPPDVKFKNEDFVYLNNINTIDSGICLVSGVDAKRMMVVLVNKVHGNGEL